MNYTSCTYIHYICLLHNYCKIILPYNMIQLLAGNLPHLASSTFLKPSLRQHFSPKVHKWYVNLPKDNPGREVARALPRKKMKWEEWCISEAHIAHVIEGGKKYALPLPPLSSEKCKVNEMQLDPLFAVNWLGSLPSSPNTLLLQGFVWELQP